MLHNFDEYLAKIQSQILTSDWIGLSKNLQKNNRMLPESISEFGKLAPILYPLFLRPLPENQAERFVFWEAESYFENCLCKQKKQTLGSTLYLKKIISDDEIVTYYNSDIHSEGISIDEEQKFVAYLQPYFSWIEKKILTDIRAHYKIIWKIFCYTNKPLVLKIFAVWIVSLQKRGLLDQDFLTTTLEACFLEETILSPEFIEAANTGTFISCLQHVSHKNELLQAAAAKHIGAYYQSTEIINKLDLLTTHPFPDLLQKLSSLQKNGYFVFGGFLDGLIETENLKELEAYLVRHEITNISVRDLMLETALHSPDEPYIPSAQAFWFYLHEYFDYDTEAVALMITHQKYFLAAQCIMESYHYGSADIMQKNLDRLRLLAPDIISENYLIQK